MEFQLEKLMQEKRITAAALSRLTIVADEEKKIGIGRAGIKYILTHGKANYRSIVLLCLALKVSPNQLLGWGK